MPLPGFDDFLTALTQAVNSDNLTPGTASQIQRLNGTLQRSREPTEPPEDTGPVAKKKKTYTSEITKAARKPPKSTNMLQPVVPDLTADRLPVDAVVKIIMDKQDTKISVTEAQNRALQQLLLGIESDADWRGALEPYISNAAWNISQFLSKVPANTEDNVAHRDLLLVQSQHAVNVNNCIARAGNAQQVHALNLEIYVAHNPDGFEDLDEKERLAELKKPEIAAKVKDFIQEREDFVRQCNQLDTTYTLCGSFVLLHPFFQLTNLGTKRRGYQNAITEIRTALEISVGGRCLRDRLRLNEIYARAAITDLLQELFVEADATRMVEFFDKFWEDFPSDIAPQ
ncbi:hypothetical protein C8F01DRAFT_1267558 [Mycena amicta]|nr:hypothetical protein C8F01DRAFT_1267558 [Mycena amicta]